MSCHGLVSVALARNWDTCGRNIGIPLFSTPQPGCQSPPGFSYICGKGIPTQTFVCDWNPGWGGWIDSESLYFLAYFEELFTMLNQVWWCHIPAHILLLQDHYQAAKKTETHPDEGTWPAYPSGKSWDEASLGRWKQPTKPWSVPGWLTGCFFCDSLVPKKGQVAGQIYFFVEIHAPRLFWNILCVLVLAYLNSKRHFKLKISQKCMCSTNRGYRGSDTVDGKKSYSSQ